MTKTFHLRDLNVKRYALAYIGNLPVDKDTPLVVRVGESTRNLEQNALLWTLLECFAEQVQWPVNGQMVNITSEDWKDILSAAFKRETQRVAMGLDGGMVLLGMRTSKMGKREFSEFIEFILAAGAERGVVFEREAA